MRAVATKQCPICGCGCHAWQVTCGSVECKGKYGRSQIKAMERDGLTARQREQYLKPGMHYEADLNEAIHTGDFSGIGRERC